MKQTIQTCLALMNGNGFQWNFSITLSLSLIRNFFVNLWCFICCPAQFDRRYNFLQIQKILPVCLSLTSTWNFFFKAKTWRCLSIWRCNLSFYFILMQNINWHFIYWYFKLFGRSVLTITQLKREASALDIDIELEIWYFL